MVCSRVFDLSPCPRTGLATSEDVPRLRLRLRVRVRVRVRLNFRVCFLPLSPYLRPQVSGLRPVSKDVNSIVHLKKSKNEDEEENEEEKEKEEETSHLKKADPQLKLIR